MEIDLALYGSLARLGGGKYVAKLNAVLSPKAKIEDLFEIYKIPIEEKSYVFINAVLCDMPGLNASLHEELHDGDHVGIFSKGYMWPYQYRDGARMSKSLRKILDDRWALHHTYENQTD